MLLSTMIQFVNSSRKQRLENLVVNENLADCSRVPLAGSDEGWLSG
jgi:hypothetical protein